MEAFSITPTLSPTAAGPQSLAAGASGGADTPSQGLSFGGIFNSLQPGAGRQDLAALLAGTGLPVPQLVSQPLGEAMAVITPDSPMPEQDSLLAFARSQGLDEAAIAALWQSPAASAAAASAPPQLPALASAAPAGLNLPGLTGLSGNANLPGLSALAGTLPTNLPTTGQPPAAQATTAASAPPAVVLMGLVVQSPVQTSETPAAPTPELDGLALQQMRASLLPTANRTAPRPQQPPQPEAPVLATGSKAGDTPDIPTVTLDLQTDLAELSSLSDNGLPTPAEAPAPATTTNTPAPGTHGEAPRASTNSVQSASGPSAPQTVVSGYQLKAEHYQQLADRMGQALAQRLQEQINSGQWSMKLRLNPVELGQIDVQLDMHAGGLDARFQTDNPLTKDLILQGSGRLKDSLSQHGTTVASVWVNSDDRRQSGGNPTPQQQQRRASPGQTESRTEAVAQAPAQRSSRPDGWDMLA